MRSISDIRNDIDRLTLRRAEVMHALAEEHDSALVAEHQEIEEQIAQLWEEHRIARARIRFGERDAIIQRARHEERLERAA
jgi:galactokinase/mevalonate kinase-like predicted kinase